MFTPKYPDPERLDFTETRFVEDIHAWRGRIEKIYNSKCADDENTTSMDVLQLFGPFMLDPVGGDLTLTTMEHEKAEIYLQGNLFMVAKRTGWDSWDLFFPS